MANVMSSDEVVRIAIYLPQPCSLLMVGTVDEVFAQANRLLGREKYQRFYVGRSALAVSWSTGVSLTCRYTIADKFECGVLMILADALPNMPLSDREKSQLYQRITHNTGLTIALQAASEWLVLCGMERGRVIGHWTVDAGMDIRKQHEARGQAIFRQYDNVITGCGQTATLDCLLDYLSRQEGGPFVRQLADTLCYGAIRVSTTPQCLPDRVLGDDLPSQLTEAVTLMENNIEEPLSTDEIAGLVHLSCRQLERLFKRHMHSQPAKYYLQIRLTQAQRLLRTTSYSMIQIGLMCGFSSGSHFSSSYKAFFRLTPREERANCFFAE